MAHTHTHTHPTPDSDLRSQLAADLIVVLFLQWIFAETTGRKQLKLCELRNNSRTVKAILLYTTAQLSVGKNYSYVVRVISILQSPSLGRAMSPSCICNLHFSTADSRPIAVLQCKMRNWCVVVVLTATLVAQSMAQVLIPCKL